MTATPPSRAPVTVLTVRLGRAIEASFEDATLEAGLAARVAALVDTLLSQLGIPGASAVIVQRVPHDVPPVRVQIGDGVYACAEDLTERLWEAVGGSAGTPWSWSRIDADVSDATLDFLARVVLEIVRQHPEALLGADQIRAYTPAPAEDLEAILASALAMGIALVDRDAVLGASAGSEGGDTSATARAERLVAALRSRAVHVKLRREDLEELLERDVDGSLPVATLALPEDPFKLLMDGLFSELGVRVPPIELVPSADVSPGCVVVRLNDLDGPPTRLIAPSEILVNAAPDQLRQHGITARAAVHPANGALCAVVNRRDLDTVKRAKLWSWTPLGHVALILGSELRRHAGRLIDTDTVEHELSLLLPAFPQLVEAVLEVVSITDLTRVVRGLLDEEVSVRDLRGLLERLVTFDRVVVDTVESAVFDDRLAVDRSLAAARPDETVERIEYVLSGMKPQLAYAVMGRSEALPAWLIDRKIEGRLLEHLAAVRGAGGDRLSLDQLDEIRDAFRRRLQSPADPAFAVLTAASLRRFVRELIRDELPRVRVLSHTERPHSLHVEELGRVEL